jgi:hypothetical protein
MKVTGFILSVVERYEFSKTRIKGLKLRAQLKNVQKCEGVKRTASTALNERLKRILTGVLKARVVSVDEETKEEKSMAANLVYMSTGAAPRPNATERARHGIA